MELSEGNLYRVSAYVGGNAAGEPKLYTNACGGGVELLSLNMEQRTPFGASVGGDSETKEGVPIPLILFVGALLVVVGTVWVKQLRSSKP